MGGVELDLAELAVLRPIQTAAAGAASTTAAARPAGDNDADGPDSAHTGCVTPTATSSLLPRMVLGGGLLDIDPAAAAAAIGACVTPTASPCLLRPTTVCPPAPRKPARPAPPPDNKRKRCCARPGLQRAFFPVPHDLSTVFVPRGRGPADRSSPPPPPPRAAKKIRLHVVG